MAFNKVNMILNIFYLLKLLSGFVLFKIVDVIIILGFF